LFDRSSAIPRFCERENGSPPLTVIFQLNEQCFPSIRRFERSGVPRRINILWTFPGWNRLWGEPAKPRIKPKTKGQGGNGTRQPNAKDRLVELTSERPPAEHFSCYGDSSYPQQDRICCKRDGNKFSELNEAMNGCRKSIEWMHRDLTQYWRVIGRKNAFHLLTGFERADDLIELCFTFSDAWNTMNHNNETAQWFRFPPPSFEVYTAEGPRDEELFH
jgi:hypothetical protein